MKVIKKPRFSAKDLAEQGEQLIIIEREHWAKEGITLPGGAKLIWLAILYKYMGCAISKSFFTKVVKECHDKDAAEDQQVRHLKRDGFDVAGSGRSKGKFANGKTVPNGYYVLNSINPEKDWSTNRDKRSNGIGEGDDWEALKNSYRNSCGVCGKSNCNLEKGHMNPKKSDVIENIIPLCLDCNLQQEEHYVIDIHGKTVYVLDDHLIKKAPYEIKRAICDKLNLEIYPDTVRRKKRIKKTQG